MTNKESKNEAILEKITTLRFTQETIKCADIKYQNLSYEFSIRCTSDVNEFLLLENLFKLYDSTSNDIILKSEPFWNDILKFFSFLGNTNNPLLNLYIAFDSILKRTEGVEHSVIAKERLAFFINKYTFFSFCYCNSRNIFDELNDSDINNLFINYWNFATNYYFRNLIPVNDNFYEMNTTIKQENINDILDEHCKRVSQNTISTNRIKKIKIISQWIQNFITNEFTYKDCLYTEVSEIKEELIEDFLVEKYNTPGDFLIITFDNSSTGQELSHAPENNKIIDITEYYPLNNFISDNKKTKAFIHIDTFFEIKKDFLYSYESKCNICKGEVLKLTISFLRGEFLKVYANRTSISSEKYDKALALIYDFINEKYYDICKTEPPHSYVPLYLSGMAYIEVSVGENVQILSFKSTGMDCDILFMGINNYRKKRQSLS